MQSALSILIPATTTTATIASRQVFPYKYWKEGYRPFANEYGLFHGWSQNARATTAGRRLALSFVSQPACMQWARCREFARRDDVVMDAGTIEAITALAHHASGEDAREGAGAKGGRGGRGAGGANNSSWWSFLS